MLKSDLFFGTNGLFILCDDSLSRISPKSDRFAGIFGSNLGGFDCIWSFIEPPISRSLRLLVEVQKKSKFLPLKAVTLKSSKFRP